MWTLSLVIHDISCDRYTLFTTAFHICRVVLTVFSCFFVTSKSRDTSRYKYIGKFH